MSSGPALPIAAENTAASMPCRSSHQHHHGLPPHRAVAVVADAHDREMRTLLDLADRLPDLGDAEIADDLRRYVAMLGQRIRANLDWSHECGRYRSSVAALRAAHTPDHADASRPGRRPPNAA